MSFDLSKSGLPKKILIGPFPHDVVFKDLAPCSSHPVFGCYTYEELEIAFSPQQVGQEFAADSVLHEVLHGIWRVGYLHQEKGSASDAEEKIISVLTTGLVQLLKVNPLLLKWLVKQIKP